ncbi:MAG: DUF4139 domain-containing protein, partial [Candidatus Zixiibacteriota bacterium]
MRKVLVATVMLLVVLAGTALADGLAVTVYNSNLGVISETRTLQFESGLGRLAFRDVPSQIDPASVRFEVADERGTVSILEQNYAFDLVKPAQLYDKYVDEQIELIDKEGKLFSGILLAHGGGSVTLQDPSGKVKIVSMGNISEVNFPALPEGLISRPTLFWLYRSDLSGERECEVGYQTTGLNWSAEYVGVLNDEETRLGLTGWSSINNTSGKTYKDAKLKLVAGDIHRVTPKKAGRGMAMEFMAAAVPEAGGFEEKAFFEYHLYTLPRTATLANREIKQIALFDPAETSVEKILAYSPEKHPTRVEVAVKFRNSEETGLGMPLPAGRVRVFKADDDGSLILLGEDRIQHTPRNEELKLTIGTAFDLVGEQTLVRQDRISKQVEDREFKIELRNHKDEDVT